MADFRRYQPRRSSARRSWRGLVLVVVAILVLILLGKWVFGGSKSSTNNNEPQIALVNDDSGNTNTGINTNGVINVNGSTNTNSSIDANVNTNTTPAANTANILSKCPGAVSQIGELKETALTFDLSAENDAANSLISTLVDKKIPAAFFSSGTFSEKHASFLKKIVEAGFPVYNKGYSTSKFSSFSASDVTTQLQKGNNAISAATNVSSKPFFRPPYGDIAGSTVTAARAAGYCTVLWTVDGYDWQEGQTVDGSLARIKDKLRAGSIVLLHAGYDITPAVVSGLTTELSSRGLTAVNLTDLFR